MNDGRAPMTFARRLVLIALGDYEDGTARDQAGFRDGIIAQVAVVEDWWAGPHLEDERRFAVSTAPKPLRSVHDLRTFLIDEDLAEADDDEALVLYITGHGLDPGAGRHFLRLTDTDENRPLGTAFPTAEAIVAALDSRAGHVLIMVDSCFSGLLKQELGVALKALEPDRRALPSLTVVTAGHDESRPRVGAFAALLAAIRAHCEDEANGYARPHLTWEEWHAIAGKVWDDNTMANARRIWPDDSITQYQSDQEPSPCLPNPGYQDIPLVEDARAQIGWTRADLDGHWIARASGRMSGQDVGWYFTGRTDLIRQIIAFLNGDDQALIVTGQAGSGKSALLARLVTLSDPRFRADETHRPFLDLIPPDLHIPLAAVDAAVLARNADPQDLAIALYEALTGTSASPGRGDIVQMLRTEALDMVRRLSRPLMLVVDGIDEARIPRRIITDVLRPLADLREHSRPAVRLILGIRSSLDIGDASSSPEAADNSLVALLQRAVNAGPPLRTDDSTAGEDVAAYAAALLRAEPVGGTRLLKRNDADVRRIAAAVAEEVSPSFLDARLAVQQLHGQFLLPYPAEAAWRQRLREGTQELLRQDLLDVAEHTQQQADHLLAVLQAAAFAQGAGLAWGEVWPAAVRALTSGDDIDGDALISHVRDSRLIGYLTTAIEDGRTVYRPVHERISETLRTTPDALLSPHTDDSEHDSYQEYEAYDPDDFDTLFARPAVAGPDARVIQHAHRALARAFAAQIEDGLDRTPHPYLRRHLIAHAAAGGVLDDEHVPASFLPFEVRGDVRARLGLPADLTAGRQRLAAWARIEPFLADAPPSTRADSLALSQTRGRAPIPPVPVAVRRPGFQPLWNMLHLPANILGSTASDIYQLVAFRTSDADVVLAAGDAGGTVTMWDPVAGTPFGLPITGLGRHLRAMAVTGGWRRTDPIIAAGSDAGLFLCDPQTGRTHHVLGAGVRALASFTAPDGSPRLAVGTSSTVLVLAPDTGEVLAERTPDGGDRTERSGYGRRSRDTVVNALAAVTLPNGNTLLAVGQESNYVHILDAGTLQMTGALSGQGRGVSALHAFVHPDGEARLVTASRSLSRVRVWNPITCAEERHLRPIHESVASMTSYGDTHDRLLVTGSSVDGSIKVWDTRDGDLIFQLPTEHTKRVRGLAVFKGPAMVPIVASGSFDRTVRLWNPADFRVLAPARRPRNGRTSVADENMTQPTVPAATLLATLSRPSRSAALIAVGSSGQVDLRSAETGEILHAFIEAADTPRVQVTALTVPEAWPTSDVPILVGYADGRVLMAAEGGLAREIPGRGWSGGRLRAMSVLPHTDPEQAVLAAGFSDGLLTYISLCDGGNSRPPVPAGWRTEGAVRSLVALPHSRGALLAVAARAVRLLHPGQQSRARLPQRIGGITTLACFTPSADEEPLLATGGVDGTVRLWDPMAPRHEAYPPLTGHRGPLTAIATLNHPNVERPLLVTASSDDTTIRLWHHETGEEVLRLVTAAPVTSLAVMPSGTIRDMDLPLIAVGSLRGLAAVSVRI
ncbi:AAA family ATPase [Streptomyces sp. NPDC008317]|uniref:AAA family ATPase n=1 Tax=Streptomyces sp. NPDC008317 TaxID=3364827 RepID=UPI0036E48C1F